MHVFFFELGYDLGYANARNRKFNDIDKLATDHRVEEESYDKFRAGYEYGYAVGKVVC